MTNPNWTPQPGKPAMTCDGKTLVTDLEVLSGAKFPLRSKERGLSWFSNGRWGYGYGFEGLDLVKPTAAILAAHGIDVDGKPVAGTQSLADEFRDNLRSASAAITAANIDWKARAEAAEARVGVLELAFKDAVKLLAEALGSEAALEPQAVGDTMVEQGNSFQARVADAHDALFHDDPTDLNERRDRFYEEATEAVQALGMTEADAHALVAYTFSRPVGEPAKEIGATALTLASLCVVGGWDMMECAEADLAVLTSPEKIAKVRAKRATRHGRGPLPGLTAAPQAAKGGE